jgi:hypothetical protein
MWRVMKKTVKGNSRGGVGEGKDCGEQMMREFACAERQERRGTCREGTAKTCAMNYQSALRSSTSILEHRSEGELLVHRNDYCVPTCSLT